MESVKQNNDQTVVVDHSYFWQPMDTCPLGYKVQLLTVGGVATYGTASKRCEFIAWAPLPKMDDEIKSLLEQTYKKGI